MFSYVGFSSVCSGKTTLTKQNLIVGSRFSKSAKLCHNSTNTSNEAKKWQGSFTNNASLEAE